VALRISAADPRHGKPGGIETIIAFKPLRPASVYRKATGFDLADAFVVSAFPGEETLITAGGDFKYERWL
jgi:hypothetical protein